MKKSSSKELNKDLYPLTCLWHAYTGNVVTTTCR